MLLLAPGVIAIGVDGGLVNVERHVVSGAAFTDQLVHRRGFQRGPARLVRFGGAALWRGHSQFEQRIRLYSFADEGLDLEVRQRQQLDRLLELRGHHQGLGLPQIKAGAERHCQGARWCRVRIRQKPGPAHAFIM